MSGQKKKLHRSSAHTALQYHKWWKCKIDISDLLISCFLQGRESDWALAQLVCMGLHSFLFPRCFLAEAVINLQTFSDSARLVI